MGLYEQVEDVHGIEGRRDDTADPCQCRLTASHLRPGNSHGPAWYGGRPGRSKPVENLCDMSVSQLRRRLSSRSVADEVCHAKRHPTAPVAISREFTKLTPTSAWVGKVASLS